MKIEDGLPVGSAGDIETWFAESGQLERELWAVIFKKASKKQTVTIAELIDSAICWGWIDVQSKGVDDERYGIRFVPRKPGSNWSPTNRVAASRLLAAGRMQPAGAALLPVDLVCPD